MKPGSLHFEITALGARHELWFPATRRIQIGRGDGSDILLFSANVSRKHAVVERTPDSWRVIEMSTNGTMVNGVALRRASRVLSTPQVSLLIGHIHIAISVEASEKTQTCAPSAATLVGAANSEIRRVSTTPPSDSEPPQQAP